MPLNVVCVNAGNYLGRGVEYVNILFDSVRRNLTEGYQGKFVCFTDNIAEEGYDEGIELRELPEDLKGWWNKLYLFKRGVFTEEDRVLYFDLDTVITGGLDDIASYDGEFAILADFFKSFDHVYAGWQSGVMAWHGGFGAHIWDEFVKDGYPDIPGGDQAWITATQAEADLFQSMFPGAFVSYKATAGNLPEKASVVCFHGIPRPHEVVTGWVPLVWKKNGLLRADLTVMCNTENQKILENIKSACERDLEWFDFKPDHDGHVCIVGGAPSLADSMNEIAWRKGRGHQVWALNGSADYLLRHAIIPDAHVLLDARPENVSFLENAHPDTVFYVASQCHPDIFERLKGYKVIVFHNATPGAYEYLESLTNCTKPTHLFGMGSTVGIKAMILASKLGFKNIHLYGMDSSYRESEGHAYPQPLNAEDRVIDVWCGDRVFKAAPWMATQAQDFRDLVPSLIEADCIVTVAGDGLIPHMARLIAQSQTEVTNE